MAVIETRGLSLTYGKGSPMEIHALKNCNITVEAGELLCVIGHTGSGKSTLAQLLNGLIKPTEGTVLLDGEDIFANKKRLREVRFAVGLVFQYPEHQLFEETVYKDIAFGAKNKGLQGDELDSAVRRAAEFAGLRQELLDKSPFELSGGEKRRAAIAGVMAMEPRVLILDEPTAGLDPRGREQMIDRIMHYRDKTGCSVVLVSHTMEDVARCADRVLVLEKGEVARLAPTQAVFADAEALERMGLRVPQITSVFLELKRLGYDVSTAVHTPQQGYNEIMRILGKGGGM
ncbi:MAG: energy-coupling factor transporter ATPase [Ruminococcaceae bacterium]|nr:energy-coupling factor transporter ATPase [Oscillospiraceae bacterium]